MKGSTIHIIGLGVAEAAELSVPANNALHNADIVMGAERQLATIGHLLSAQQQSICTH